MLILGGTASPELGAVEGALWPTTGDIDTETDSLAIAVSALGHDVGDSNVADDDNFQTFLRAWNAFVADVDQWRASSWFWNPTRRDELLSYRARFNQMLAQARSMGIATLQTVQAAQKQPDSLDTTLALLNKIIIVGGVAAVAYIGFKIYKDLR